ncbi:Cytochrome P450 monooygenase 1 [Colletotrichum orbiculare MAFF 240422]|uniref:Cytochrome P450 monooygenase 1 n=1 Tax=Colletotrichum orbiculare (strain 104-T / ATCC 96160 / CBS 514.97 / LARS 414 / MAFF 240422) TaxID=1213857 RepID=A0A484G3P8_COLOR|nr:Cytochrome P450 monooygenase 1 [Colletotrichum orbiculare MAFF 240422]
MSIHHDFHQRIKIDINITNTRNPVRTARRSHISTRKAHSSGPPINLLWLSSRTADKCCTARPYTFGKPVRGLCDVGDVFILTPDVGQEIQNDKRFSFTRGLFEADTETSVSAERMWDPEIDDNPLTFEGYRFFRERGGSNDASGLLVTTNVNHMGSRHGMHSCPGRFFAANEAKVVLDHFLFGAWFRIPFV